MRIKVIFIFYRAALLVGLPILFLYLLWRVTRERRYLRRLSERFGFWRLKHPTPAGGVWLHAVSVGEILSSVQLIRGLREELPHTPIYVSCGTLAGREVADSQLAGLADGVFYAPLDLVFAVRKTLRVTRPAVLLVLETEIWPNLYREAKKAGAAVVIANGRISDKAAAKYIRHRWFFSAVLEHVDQILTQSVDDQKRFISAGAPAERVLVAGNLKYDFQSIVGQAPEAILPFLKSPLWIAASTTGPMSNGDVDEDDAVIASYQELLGEYPALRLLIAPRRPERFDIVADKLAAASVRFIRRSQQGQESEAKVVLLDSVGELGSLFPYGDVVFMGGTLAKRGGHNILEPALCGKPVIAGPNMENFAAIRDRFTSARGYVEIANPDELGAAVRMLLSDAGHRESLGARAKALAEAERGATSRAVRIVAGYRWMFVPKALMWGWISPFARVLAKAWSAGGKLKRAASKPRRLPKPVISIGGLAMGGVGKTPMTAFIADRFRARGYNVGILTRGYGRESTETACLRRGTDAPVSLTGDEAQLLLRSAHLGIGADRWRTGTELIKRLNPDLMLLDDGFQHAKLARDVDVVLLDGIDPLGGDGVFPAGRLREDVEALQRADILVVTRSGRRRFEGLTARLPKKPLYFADVEISGWFPGLPNLDSVLAFCGLANPQAFFETLREAGARIVATAVFSDHHRYSVDELRSLAKTAASAGARVLVTTEKDLMNLPNGHEEAIHPLKVYTVSVRTSLRDESHFFLTLETMSGLGTLHENKRAERKL